MNARTLLSADHDRSVPYHVIEDLKINNIFSEHTAHIMTHTCGRDVILKRQALFSLLEKSEYRESFSSFHRELLDVRRLTAMYKKTPQSAAKTYILAALERRYISACRMMAPLRGCELTDALYDFWCCGEHEKLLDSVSRAVEAAAPDLSTLSRFDLSFHEKSWLTADLESVPYIETVRECAASLGFSVDGGARMRTHPNGITVSASIDAPLCAFFSAELEGASSALVPFKALLADELSALSAETSFCLEICEFMDGIRSRGLPLAFPRIAGERKYFARGACDPTLTHKSAAETVPNDIDFCEGEEFYFLLGANGGGKTTYLRTVGVNLLLFLSGAPIVAEDAEIYPFRGVNTHFPVDERSLGMGRLDEERVRADAMLASADPDDSFLIFNETYSGTDDKLGCELTKKTADALSEKHVYGIYVTHFHELYSAGGGYNFLEAVVDEKNGNARTYRIVKQSTKRGSFAFDILKKYGLDRASLERRDAT